jgi:hypothetical protein
VSVRYVGRESSGMSVCFMYVFQVGCTREDDCVDSFGNFRCWVFAVSRSVVLRVSMHVRSWRSEEYIPLFGSRAMIASVFLMCS